MYSDKITGPNYVSIHNTIHRPLRLYNVLFETRHITRSISLILSTIRGHSIYARHVSVPASLIAYLRHSYNISQLNTPPLALSLLPLYIIPIIESLLHNLSERRINPLSAFCCSGRLSWLPLLSYKTSSEQSSINSLASQ